MFLLDVKTCPGPICKRLWLLDKTMALWAQYAAGCFLPLPLGWHSGVPGTLVWVSARRMTIQAKEIDFYLFLNTKENYCLA